MTSPQPSPTRDEPLPVSTLTDSTGHPIDVGDCLEFHSRLADEGWGIKKKLFEVTDLVRYRSESGIPAFRVYFRERGLPDAALRSSVVTGEVSREFAVWPTVDALKCLTCKNLLSCTLNADPKVMNHAQHLG